MASPGLSTSQGFYGNRTTVPKGSTASIQHILGQWGGRALVNAPGNLGSTLGSNIINPSVNYKGIANPGYTLGDSTTSGTTSPTGDTTQQTQQTQQTDPYAQWGGQANYDNLISSFNTQKQNITSGANEWAQNYGLGLGQNITDYISGLRTNQQGIDEQGVQNELALKQGRQGILGMVSRGIRSGGVMLANRNASDSSASAALANAYGEIGRGQMSNIGNQHAIQDRNIGLAQDQFNTQAQAGANRMRTQETQDIAGAVSGARDQLAALDAWAADRSLPERIAVEQEKAKIQDQINATLSQYGDQLNTGVAGVQPTSLEQRRGTANQLAGAGTVSTSPFEFASQVPYQFQTGQPAQPGSPLGGMLPLITLPRKKIA
jgi:hypothetical protein